MEPIDLAIVIVNWNGRDLLARCLRSIAATAGDLRYAVYVVDNGSTDGSREMVRAEFPSVLLREPEANLGFAGGNNVALRAILAGAEVPPYILLLNPDTIVQEGALQALVHAMAADPTMGMAGALLLNEDGSFQASYVDFPTLGQEFMILTGLGRKLKGSWYPSYSLRESAEQRAADYVIGACMLVRSAALAQVGLMDEGFFMYSEETDWCYRFHKAGWRVTFVPQSVIIHLGGGSTRQVRAAMLVELYRSRVRFFRKHYGPLPAFGLQALLVGMNLVKSARALLPRPAGGTPPLSWGMLRRALRG